MADINRAEAEALMARQDINEVFQQAAEGSAALRTFRTVNMGTATARLPVIDALPTAGFVTEAADATGVKPTAQTVWANKTLTAEEIAVIVPIHENVFDDTSINVWGEVRPRIAEALGAVLDGAVFFGTNKPASWPDSLEDGARAAGNVRSAAAAGDLAEDINQTWALVEADGYDVNVNYARRSLRASLRGLRDADNQPIYLTSLRADGATNMIYGADLEWVTNGSWVNAGAGAGATLISGDRTKAILGIRQDVTFKLLTEATVGTLNLAERDMVALRAKFRVAFQVADATTIEGGATAYPFAILAE
jgi:HK97 family phage major capsid protein